MPGLNNNLNNYFEGRTNAMTILKTCLIGCIFKISTDIICLCKSAEILKSTMVEVSMIVNIDNFTRFKHMVNISIIDNLANNTLK